MEIDLLEYAYKNYTSIAAASSSCSYILFYNIFIHVYMYKHVYAYGDRYIISPILIIKFIT